VQISVDGKRLIEAETFADFDVVERVQGWELEL
jgi:hypothetical protein